MGRKTNCLRKDNSLKCRNLSDCQRNYIEEQAAIKTIERGYVISQSAIISEIIGEKMRKENFFCEN